ncbi:hypothetical protein GCM10010497_25000 [Streptomyces cinereoruber]|uniref:Uncharacterized protein n=1 Tax=Streptomyces cinereoruber TaxID=67260 RepID=A0AAV4KG11_9ACTN|nr:hypothetical protein GCM10010497_25000 [Streptomyces cinereoruber]
MVPTLGIRAVLVEVHFHDVIGDHFGERRAVGGGRWAVRLVYGHDFHYQYVVDAERGR